MQQLSHDASVIHCDLYRSEGALPDEVDEALDTNPDWCSSNGPSGLQPRICPRNVWTSCFKSAKITVGNAVPLWEGGALRIAETGSSPRFRGMTAKRKGFCLTGHDEGLSYAYSGTKIGGTSVAGIDRLKCAW